MDTELLEIKEFIKGKRVAIVGNSASIFNNKFGKEIDDHEVIVRFNRGFTTKPECQGSKTDILLLACDLSTNQLKSFNVKYVINRSESNTVSTEYQLSKEFIIDASVGLGYAASTGLLAIQLCLDSKAGQIDVYGFDGGLTPTYYNPPNYMTKHNYYNEAIRITSFIKQKKINVRGRYREIIIDDECRDIKNPVLDLIGNANYFKNYDIISFDIFDTLVVRPFVKPIDLFEYIGGKDFRDERRNAERRSRDVTGEVTFDKIYDNIDAQYKHLKSVELQTEYDLIMPYVPVVKLFNYLKSIGKKIILVSDMYLSSETLKKMLTKCGITGYDKLYVSCEYSLSKARGTLYKKVLKDYNIAPNKVLHFGDNAGSDIEKAKSLGLSAYKVEKALDLLLKKNHRLTQLEDNLQNSYFIGSHIFFDKPSYWEYIGRIYGRFSIYPYMYWLKEQVKEKNIDTLVFAGRDGDILYKVYKKIDPSMNIVYCYANRQMGLNEKEGKADYTSYFNSLNLKGRIAMVDTTTWGFSAQNVSKIKTAFYFWQRREHPTYETYSFSPVMNNTDLVSWELMETFMSAPEPPVKDIGLDNKPIYNSYNSDEAYRIKIIKELQKGVLETPYLENINFQYSNIRDIVNNFLINFTQEDINEFSKLKFANEPGHGKYHNLIMFCNTKGQGISAEDKLLGLQTISRNTDYRKCKCVLTPRYVPNLDVALGTKVVRWEDREKYKDEIDLVCLWGTFMAADIRQGVNYAYYNNLPVVIAENGFIRSVKAWSNDPKCTAIEHNGYSFIIGTYPYFDANHECKIVQDLNTVDLTPEQMKFARECIDYIVENKLTKYNHQPLNGVSFKGNGKVNLVIDQSYGDASIGQGWGSDAVFEQMYKDASSKTYETTLVKTHPESNLGQRSGYYNNLQTHDNVIIYRKNLNPITLINSVDDVYVCSSQFGFEALMCGKTTHIYGMPIYAGWGLTPFERKHPKRNRTRTLEEVFYILYIMNTIWVSPKTNKVTDIMTVLKDLKKLRDKYHQETCG